MIKDLVEAHTTIGIRQHEGMMETVVQKLGLQGSKVSRGIAARWTSQSGWMPSRSSRTATSEPSSFSLEMKADIGSVDCVVQVGSVPWATACRGSDELATRSGECQSTIPADVSTHHSSSGDSKRVSEGSMDTRSSS